MIGKDLGSMQSMVQYFMQAKQLGHMLSARTKSWMQNDRVRRGREVGRQRRSGCLLKLSQDLGNAAMAN